MSNKNSICNSHYNMRKKKLEKMKKEAEKKWLDPRRYYINSFLNHQSLQFCPECYGELTTTEDEDETICTSCGLITSMSIEYVAGQKINLPYGRH